MLQVRLFFISFLLVSSTMIGCRLISVNGNFGGLTSNFHNTNKSCPTLFADSLTSLYKEDTLFKYVRLTGLDLKRLLETHDTAIVYIWAPRCHSQFCPSINDVVNKYKNPNTQVFIVAEYYDCILMQMKKTIPENIIGIDIKYYKTNLTDKYLTKFLFDLTGQKDLQTGIKRLLKFHKGEFIGKFNSY